MLFKTTITKDITVPYHLIDFSKEDKGKTMLMVFLHGSGSRGENPERHSHLFDKEHIKKRNLVIAIPTCKPDGIWEADDIAALTNHLQLEFGISAKRTCLAGHSMGARGVWMTACMYPEYFGNLVPVSGYSYYLMASRLTNLRIACFHADNDDAVPLSQSQIMCQSILESGGKRSNLLFKVMKGFGHHNICAVLSSTLLYDWLFNA